MKSVLPVDKPTFVPSVNEDLIGYSWVTLLQLSSSAYTGKQYFFPLLDVLNDFS